METWKNRERKDGIVRVVDVKEGDKVYRRSVERISLLEFGASD